jgi:hypothetical protein
MSSPGVKPAPRWPRRAAARPPRWSRGRGEAALVADGGGQAAVVQHALEHVVGLGAPAQRLGEAGRAHRHDHELLEVDVVVGVGAAVEHVHHRHRQHVGVGAADVAVQRQAQLVGGGLGHGERHAEDGVGAEAGLVVGAVEVDQQLVDAALVEGLEPTSSSAISPLTWRRRRARPCRRSGRRRRAARRPRTARWRRPRGRWPDRAPGGEDDLDLDGGVAAGVDSAVSSAIFGNAPCTSSQSKPTDAAFFWTLWA